MSTLARKVPPPGAEPVWEIARLYPPQGCWSEEEYHHLDTNQLVEFTDGYVEFLAMPTTNHQAIVLFLYHLLYDFVNARSLGNVQLGPTKLRIRPKKVREPDIFLLGAGITHQRSKHFYEGAAMVMEVVSEDDDSHTRDWEQKRADYAEAHVPEYWIVDPQLRKIMVLKLAGHEYQRHAEVKGTGLATSALLPGFEVDASHVWQAGLPHPPE